MESVESGRGLSMEISDMVSEENCTQGWTCGGGRTMAGPSEELVKRDGPMAIMIAELSSNSAETDSTMIPGKLRSSFYQWKSKTSNRNL